MRLSRVFWGGAVRPQAALMGRFRKKTPTAPVAGGGKRQEDEKTKAEKAYSDQLLKSYKNATPKDTRTPEQKAAFKQESLKWSRVVLDAKKVEQAHEQKRLDFMWEAIKLVPEGPLRAHAMTEDPALPSDTMAGVMLTDIGPISESEVDRLEPLVIDHTVLQRINEEATSMDDEAKEEAKREKEEKEQGRAARKAESKAAKAPAAEKKEEAKPAAAEKKTDDKKKPAAKKDEKAPAKEEKKADKKPAKGKKD